MKIKPKKQAVRLIPGYWTTAELCERLGVRPAAIAMQVSRGQLTPVTRSPGQQYLFAASEVERYLSRPATVGRPPAYRFV